jgi:hypothetical protein
MSAGLYEPGNISPKRRKVNERETNRTESVITVSINQYCSWGSMGLTFRRGPEVLPRTQ